jgi:4-hydroxyphenylacetate decarboxylase small subunit
MDEEHKHLDCHNFAPIDVAKGICHRRKELILADECSCEKFLRMPKCKYCQNYTSGEDQYLGSCNILNPPVMTYPDLVSVTCENFVWRET